MMNISILKFSLIYSLYLLFIINFKLILEYFKLGLIQQFSDVLDALHIFFVLFIVIFLFIYVISFRYFTKFISIFILILSGLFSYGILNYNIDLNNENIIGSIFETKIPEAISFFSINFLVYFLFVSILPLILIIKSKIKYPSTIKFLKYKFIFSIIFSLFVFISFRNHQVYNAFAAETKISELFNVNFLPVNFIHGFKRYFKAKYYQNYNSKLNNKFITFDSYNKKREKNKKNFFILILGESARSKSFSLNGYERETNPKLKKQDIISFTNFYSCGTVTRVSIPCIFSNFSRKNFNFHDYDHTENLLEIVHKLGFQVSWYENGMGSQGVTRNQKEIVLGNFYNSNFDEALNKALPSKKKLINENNPKDLFFVLHQRGSHGPDYINRYPESFTNFLPSCKSSVLKSCDLQSIINSYDNSILYTDYNINYIINYLKEFEDIYNTAMMYVSDHGESTGEYGFYMHGIPYLIAPDEQIHIPFILWLSKEFQNNEKINYNCLKLKKSEHYSHDNLFHSILSLLNIMSSAYDSKLDIFKSCKMSDNL